MWWLCGIPLVHTDLTLFLPGAIFSLWLLPQLLTFSCSPRGRGKSPFLPGLPIWDRWSLPASPQLSFLHGVLSGSVCSQGSPVGLFPHCLLPPLLCPSLSPQQAELEMTSKVMSSSSYPLKTAQPWDLAQSPSSVVMEPFSC